MMNGIHLLHSSGKQGKSLEASTIFIKGAYSNDLKTVTYLTGKRLMLSVNIVVPDRTTSDAVFSSCLV